MLFAIKWPELQNNLDLRLKRVKFLALLPFQPPVLGRLVFLTKKGLIAGLVLRLENQLIK